MKYPQHPGHKEKAGTSQQAAESMKESAKGIQHRVMASLTDDGPGTTDEVAARLGLSVLSVRPRFSELLAEGVIEKSCRKRRNESGRMAAVWRLKSADSFEITGLESPEDFAK